MSACWIVLCWLVPLVVEEWNILQPHVACYMLHCMLHRMLLIVNIWDNLILTQRRSSLLASDVYVGAQNSQLVPPVEFISEQALLLALLGNVFWERKSSLAMNSEQQTVKLLHYSKYYSRTTSCKVQGDHCEKKLIFRAHCDLTHSSELNAFFQRESTKSFPSEREKSESWGECWTTQSIIEFLVL